MMINRFPGFGKQEKDPQAEAIRADIQFTLKRIIGDDFFLREIAKVHVSPESPEAQKALDAAEQVNASDKKKREASQKLVRYWKAELKRALAMKDPAELIRWNQKNHSIENKTSVPKNN